MEALIGLTFLDWIIAMVVAAQIIWIENISATESPSID
jgi:hypothetical protein